MTYQEQLQTQEWEALRSKRIEKDFEMCQICMATKNLQVHHKYYVSGRMAWEYPLIALTTLCDNCHKILHESNKIGQASPLDLAFERLYIVTHV